MDKYVDILCTKSLDLYPSPYRQIPHSISYKPVQLQNQLIFCLKFMACVLSINKHFLFEVLMYNLIIDAAKA